MRACTLCSGQCSGGGRLTRTSVSEGILNWFLVEKEVSKARRSWGRDVC